MRVECPSCRQIVSPALGIDAADVGMPCPSCSATIPPAALAAGVTDDEVAAATPIPRVKDASCPKCATPLKASATACASCGLATSRMASFISEQNTAVTESIRAAWDKIVETWDDEARHDALFKLVAERGEYGWAAGRYREQARARTGDPIAARQLERIRRAIEATLIVSGSKRETPQPSPYKNVIALFGVLIILLAVGMFYVFVKSKHAPADDADPTPPRPQSITPAPRVR